MVLGLCCGVGATACCCAGSCMGNLCCCCAGRGIKASSYPRITYVVLQLFFVLLSFVLMFTLKAAVDEIGIISCTESSGMGVNSTYTIDGYFYGTSAQKEMTQEEKEESVSSACLGISAVLRMSFTLFIFHAVIFFAIIPRNDCASILHDGFWCCKFLLVITLFTCFFFLHIDFFDVWMEICRYVSICFLLLQTIYMVSSAFSFNDYIKLAYSDDESTGHWIMLLLSIILNGGALVITSFCIVWFLGSEETLTLMKEMHNSIKNSDKEFEEPTCGANLTYIILTYLFIIISLVMGFCRCRDDSTIFTSGLVSFWLSFLLWSSLASQPDTYCNTLHSSGWATFTQIVSWILFTFICMTSLSIATKASDGSKEKGTSAAADIAAQDGDAEQKAKDIEVITKIDGDGKEQIEKGDEVFIFPVTAQTLKFQLILMVCSCHYSMILTNWGDPVVNNVKTNYFSQNWVSFWIKMSMQWLSFFLFILANLIAKCFPDRDFS